MPFIGALLYVMVTAAMFVRDHPRLQDNPRALRDTTAFIDYGGPLAGVMMLVGMPILMTTKPRKQ